MPRAKDPQIPRHDRVPLADTKGREDSKLFHTACELARIRPTRRQLKKWKKREGLAHSYKRRAHKHLEKIAE